MQSSNSDHFNMSNPYSPASTIYSPSPDSVSSATSNREHTAITSQPSQTRQRLRPWLIDQINSGKTPGLEWIDPEKMIFKIPWKHFGRPGVDEYNDAMLFRNWAIHTKKYQEGQPPDISTWKTRFRCALYKLPDINELNNMNVIEGDNPYRVYQFVKKGATIGTKDGIHSPMALFSELSQGTASQCEIEYWRLERQRRLKYEESSCSKQHYDCNCPESSERERNEREHLERERLERERHERERHERERKDMYPPAKRAFRPPEDVEYRSDRHYQLLRENQQVHERLATALPRLSQCYTLNTPVVNVPKLYPVVARPMPTIVNESPRSTPKTFQNGESSIQVEMLNQILLETRRTNALLEQLIDKLPDNLRESVNNNLNREDFMLLDGSSLLDIPTDPHPNKYAISLAKKICSTDTIKVEVVEPPKPGIKENPIPPSEMSKIKTLIKHNYPSRDFDKVWESCISSINQLVLDIANRRTTSYENDF